MDRNILIEALGLPHDSNDQDVLERIERLRQLDAPDADLSTYELVQRGQHECVATDNEGATATLYYPLKSGSEMITTLRFRRPQTRDLRKMQEVTAKGGRYGRPASRSSPT